VNQENVVREVIGLKDQNNYLNAETCKSENAPNENPMTATRTSPKCFSGDKPLFVKGCEFDLLSRVVEPVRMVVERNK
jgi:hypothetical protein